MGTGENDTAGGTINRPVGRSRGEYVGRIYDNHIGHIEHPLFPVN